MGAKSDIEWTDATWTPIRARHRQTGNVGWHCEHVSPGCENCYAESMNRRLGTGLPFKPGHKRDLEIYLDDKMLTAPLRWRNARRVFVCSMTDLFADCVPDEWIDRMFAVMSLCPQHRFQVLTKRAARMRAYFHHDDGFGRWGFIEHHARKFIEIPSTKTLAYFGGGNLPNVWLGVSAEDQRRANERIPDLLSTPTAVRFVSAEPLLGPIDLKAAALKAFVPSMFGIQQAALFRNGALANVDWVIVGGESGPGARPCDLEWVEGLVDQCRLSGVPCFVKQLGSNSTWQGNPTCRRRHSKGGDPAEWPVELQVREMPA